MVAAFVLAMIAVENRIAAEIDRRQLQPENRDLSFQKQASVFITEVMSSNSLTILDGFGFSSDWIEFYNSGDEAINLRGAGLSTNINEPMMWVFPDFEIGPKEFRIVYASGLSELDSAGNLHANFKLNAQFGETLYFTSALGTLISTLELPSMDSDISYGMDQEGQWLYFNHPTPNEMNSEGGQETMDFRVYLDSPLTITEYMIDNRSVLYDEHGDFIDWVEIYNDSDAPFSLMHLFFTDDKTDLRKWAFPEITIPAKSYLLIYASGKDIVAENIHTNFRLSENETLILSNQFSEILVELAIEPLLEDISRGQQDGQWLYFAQPTPGKENSTHGFQDALSPSSRNSDVVISEVMARNDTFLADGNGNFYDWIELKNNTDQDINLAGYSLSKGSNRETKFIFQDYVLPAHGFAVFFADEEVAVDGSGNGVPFSISASGETLSLCDLDCTDLQIFETGFLGKNASSGLDQQGERVFFETPTPAQPNSAVYANRYSSPVHFSLEGGEISDGQLLTLTAEPGAEIFFTLDGSTPTVSDDLYVQPFEIDKTMTVRAIAAVAGQLPSTVATHTYIVGVEHDLPIIALSTDPEHLFGYDGIYSNWGWEVERPVHVAFYETDGLAFSFDAGFEIAGGSSQEFPQKSFAIHLRKDYGTEELNYPLFAGNEVTSFRHLLLRTSGQDQYMTKVRDAFIQRAVMNVIDLDVMDSRPCVVYLNGEYWGVYNIREKVNEDYLASHYGLDPNRVDILLNNGQALAGSNEDYKALMEYAETHDMQVQEHYEYVASQVDIDNLMDYLIVHSYFGNTSLDIKYWRDQSDGKWRWVLYDLDWALFKGTHTWNNMRAIFNPEGLGDGNWIDTTLQVELLKNEHFREEFIRRYAYYANTYFTPERLLPMFNEMVAEIESEMPRNEQRWPNNWGGWALHVSFVRQILQEKPEIERNNLQRFFRLSDEEMQELFP
ncbi:MAG: CotH kinase family protein [Anaerolineales bacterium]|nr:MAG: CotH kinase family protein [Anaerolineales bacterium]